MANIYENMNVRQKLAKARLYFLNQKVQKSGKNFNLQFKYFELSDIVPTAIRIFARVGLTTETKFLEDKAVMTVYNADNAEEPGIEFVAPYKVLDPIISNQGKQVTNTMQAIGSTITYTRRYLWMLVLDVTEPDEIDATLGGDDEEPETPEIEAPSVEPKPTKKKSSAPATKKERENAKKEMTDTDGQADALQINALKNACRTLRELDPDMDEFVGQIELQTNAYTKVTRSQAETLILKLNEVIEQYPAEEVAGGTK